MSSGASQLQGMAGLHGSNAGKVVKTPLGFGVVTRLFADMRRHYAGSWFVGIDTQQDLHERAVMWRHKLSGFSTQVIESAMDEVVWRGDVSAPSLDTIRYLCVKKTDELNCGSSRADAKRARDRAMAELKNRGVIKG